MRCPSQEGQFVEPRLFAALHGPIVALLCDILPKRHYQVFLSFSSGDSLSDSTSQGRPIKSTYVCDRRIGVFFADKFRRKSSTRLSLRKIIPELPSWFLGIHFSSSSFTSLAGFSEQYAPRLVHTAAPPASPPHISIPLERSPNYLIRPIIKEGTSVYECRRSYSSVIKQSRHFSAFFGVFPNESLSCHKTTHQQSSWSLQLDEAGRGRFWRACSARPVTIALGEHDLLR